MGFKETLCISVDVCFFGLGAPEEKEEVLGRRPRGAPELQNQKKTKKTKIHSVSLNPKPKETKKTKIHSVSLNRGRQTLCMFGFLALQQGGGKERRRRRRRRRPPRAREPCRRLCGPRGRSLAKGGSLRRARALQGPAGARAGRRGCDRCPGAPVATPPGD